MYVYHRLIFPTILFCFFTPLFVSGQIDWVTATGLNLGDTFIDGAVYNNFAGTGLNVRINANIVSGEPSIDATDPTKVYIRDANQASITLTFLNGSGNVVLTNYLNLRDVEKVTVSNLDGENITITEISNNGGDAMTVDGVNMPTGGAPNAVTGDDSVILTEKEGLPNTFHNISMNNVTGFTWLYESSSSSTEGFELTSLSGIVLPIELTSFDAIPLLNNNIQLDWTTASETNNDYFTIERSKDGINWEQLAKVNGKGTFASTTFYRHIDQEPYAQLSYYRLKQTDFDGKFSYSAIESIHFIKNAEIKIYPNPVLNVLTISNFNAKPSELIITDVFGKNLNHLVYINSLDETNHQIEMSNLPRGIYFIRTTGSVRKIFKE